MQRPSKPVVTEAALLAVGALGGWSLPALMRDGDVAEPNASSAGVSLSGAPSALPSGTEPNYRAIFQQNQAAVVGITTAGMRKVAEDQQFDFPDPFGRGFGNGPGNDN